MVSSFVTPKSKVSVGDFFSGWFILRVTMPCYSFSLEAPMIEMFGERDFRGRFWNRWEIPQLFFIAMSTNDFIQDPWFMHQACWCWNRVNRRKLTSDTGTHSCWARITLKDVFFFTDFSWMFALCVVLGTQIQLLLLREKKPRSHLGKGTVGYRKAHRQERANLEILTLMVGWRLKEWTLRKCPHHVVTWVEF